MKGILIPTLLQLVASYAPPELEVSTSVYVRGSWGDRVSQAPILSYTICEVCQAICGDRAQIMLPESWHVYKMVFYFRVRDLYADLLEDGDLFGKNKLLEFDRVSALVADKLMHDHPIPSPPIYSITFDPEPLLRQAVLHLKGVSLNLRFRPTEGATVSVLLLCLI